MCTAYIYVYLSQIIIFEALICDSVEVHNAIRSLRSQPAQCDEIIITIIHVRCDGMVGTAVDIIDVQCHTL